MGGFLTIIDKDFLPPYTCLYRRSNPEPLMQVNLAGAEEGSSPRMGIFGASAANMLNMIGVGPF